MKLGPGGARGSEPWPVRCSGLLDRGGLSGGWAGSPESAVVQGRGLEGVGLAGKPASGVMVMVMVQPGWSLCS